MNDLKDKGGILYPILSRVRQDDTLMLAIRDNYINVYYRGGSILKVEETQTNQYSAFFDSNYNIMKFDIPTLPPKLLSKNDTSKWVVSFPQLKAAMDSWLSKHNKPEREFQQLVARENNFSTISNSGEYFITDIEFADSELGARFDMLALQWPARQRQSSKSCRVTLIEMKYGDDQLEGEAGIMKHLQDMDSIINDKDKYTELVSIIETQFNQLYDLGLIKVNIVDDLKTIKLDTNIRPEVIFLLANHNPRSTKLKTIINALDIGHFSKLDIKFFVSSFAGYGMHSDCMLSFKQFQEILNK